MRAALDTVRLPVEAGKVAELNRALLSTSDAVPPTFTVVSAHHTPPGRSVNELVIAAAGLDAARVLLGEVAWEYQRPLLVGDVLEGEVSREGTASRQGRRGGAMTLVRGATTWHDGGGRPVARTTVTLIAPEGPAATRPVRPPDAPADGDAILRLTRTDIVRYAGASGDFNPVHHDEGHARALGYPGVFAMGMLPAGILACRAAGAAGLTRLAVRFQGQVWPDVRYRIAATGARSSLVDATGTAVLHVETEGGR
jgi:peroxisomal enoyl-CoA hydratase 2